MKKITVALATVGTALAFASPAQAHPIGEYVGHGTHSHWSVVGKAEGHFPTWIYEAFDFRKA